MYCHLDPSQRFNAVRPQVSNHTVPPFETRSFSGNPAGDGSCCQPFFVWWKMGLAECASERTHWTPKNNAADITASRIKGALSEALFGVGCVSGDGLVDIEARPFAH
jgi:hypothetical protein